MKYFVLLLIPAVLFLGSCNDDPLGAQSEGQIEPLTVGNYWIYSLRSMDSLGAVKDTMQWFEVVDSDTMIDGQRYHSVSDLFTLWFGLKIFYINKSDGLYRFTRDVGPLSIFIKYPVKKNEVIYREYDTLTVLNTEQKVITPAGTFYCVVYRRTVFESSVLFYETMYYCPGIGKIQVETGYSRDGVNIKPASSMQLVAYEIR